MGILNKDINKNIDSRIVDILWDNLKSMEDGVEKEVLKAGYIIGFQGTILFVMAMKMGNLDNFFLKLFILILFITSSIISYLTISGEGKIKHLKFDNYEKFDRREIIEKLNEFYKIAEKLFFRKMNLNKINMLLLEITIFFILVILLFPGIF